MKNRSGITLIALVITIIVLLILAGVSISMLSGENGIIQRAALAKSKSEIANLKEEVQMLLTGRSIEKSTEGNNKKSFKEELESGISDVTIESVNSSDDSEGLTDVYYVNRRNLYITVYEDGTIEEGKTEIWDGEKISCPEFKNENNVWNWYIYTPSQLKFLADFVNNDNSLTDEQKTLATNAGYNIDDITIELDSTNIFLMKNLDMGARAYSGNTEVEQWENENNEKVKWTPIGLDLVSKSMIGVFDGNGHEIRGVYVKYEGQFAGLFGFARNVKNLTVKDSYVKGMLDESNDVCGVGEIAGCCTVR